MQLHYITNGELLGVMAASFLVGVVAMGIVMGLVP